MVLNCANWFDEAARLMDLGFERYEGFTALSEGETVRVLPVTDGTQDTVYICAGADLTAPVKALGMRQLLVGLLALAVSGGLLFSVSRSILGPLNRLLETTERVKAGDLTVQAGLASRDELARVGRALDEVIESMYQTGKDMNAKYRETSTGGLARAVRCE